MNNASIMIGLIVVGLILLVVLPMLGKKSSEGFNTSSGLDMYDSFAKDRIGFNKFELQNANHLAPTISPTAVNIAGSDDPDVVMNMSKQIQGTMNSVKLVPQKNKGSYLGTTTEVSLETLPPPSAIIAEAKKCQSLKGRDACAALKDPNFNKCGVCILKGTPWSPSDPNPDEGKWIGGLLVLPEDRKLAEAEAGNRNPIYQPTVGDCPGGYLYVDSDICTKEANRQDCVEYGASGGFGTPTIDSDGNVTGYTGTGVTAEGKAPKTCAQIPAAGSDQYIYDPKDRTATINLRVVFPSTTGYHRIRIYDSNNKLVGSAEGTDTVLVAPVSKVQELNRYRVYIGMETPQMAFGGQNELFLFKRQLTPQHTPMRNPDIRAICQSIGAGPAIDRLYDPAFNAGGQVLVPGFPEGHPLTTLLQANVPGVGKGKPGANYTGSDGVGDPWCVGVKPPPNKGDTELNLNSTPYPFFTPADNASPSQRTSPMLWSKHEDGEYQAPGIRAFVAQWETASDTHATRVIPFEPTITGVAGNNNPKIDKDGFKTFNNLKRFGTFATSSQIRYPRPNDFPSVLTNQFWIWSGQWTRPTAYFDVQLPNIFLDSFYKEDRSVSRVGPLIGDPFSMRLMATSPCLAAGQEPGKYSMKCLLSMFIGAGGDPYAGKLATENGGLAQLNKYGNGSMDTISAYLNGLYTMIMTGRDANGKRVGMNSNGTISPVKSRNMINEASQLMFGYNMVSPCEYLTEDDGGNIVINVQPASQGGTLDALCMDYLYMNTYSSKSREQGSDNTSGSSIRNTYTNYPVSLADRHSGLRNGEGKQEDRDKFPFQACQRTGTLSPIKPDGQTVNHDAVKYVNSQAYPLTKAGYRMVDAVQLIFDSWHKTANYWSNSMIIEAGAGGRTEAKGAGALAETAVRMCYGINKSVDSSGQNNNCGARARYVRMLASMEYLDQSWCLQIPQLQVFTTDGAEVAKGKHTWSRNLWGGTSTPDKAVNGNATPHSHGEGEYHGRCDGRDSVNDWWMVDLGKTYNIGSAKFYPRTDCCSWRQVFAPVQLLDEARNVVAEQRIWDQHYTINNYGVPYTLNFNNAVAAPRYSKKALLSSENGTSVSIRNAVSGMNVKYLGIPGVNNTGPCLMVYAGTPSGGINGDASLYSFTIVPSTAGIDGAISIQAPQGMLGAPPNHHMFMFMESAYFKTSICSYILVPALNGDKAGYSLQSPDDKRQYLVMHWQDKHNIVGMSTVSNEPSDMRRAVWYFTEPPNSRGTNMNMPPFTGEPLYGNIGY